MAERFQDIMMGLGDAIAGVDRSGAFMAGQKARGEFDHVRAQTDAAMELAKQRRIQAEIDEKLEKDRDLIRATEQSAFLDPARTPYGALIAGKMGSDFSQVTSGAGNAQDYQLRERIATPAGQPFSGPGMPTDVMDESHRQAAMEALSPSSVISGQAGIDRVRATPPRGGGAGGAGGGRPVANIQETLFLESRGHDPRIAEAIAFGEFKSADDAYAAAYRQALANFDRDPAGVAQRAAEDWAMFKQDNPSIPPPVNPPAPLMAPPGGDADVDMEGDTATNPQTGQTMVFRNGQWVPM